MKPCEQWGFLKGTEAGLWLLLVLLVASPSHAVRLPWSLSAAPDSRLVPPEGGPARGRPRPQLGGLGQGPPRVSAKRGWHRHEVAVTGLSLKGLPWFQVLLAHSGQHVCGRDLECGVVPTGCSLFSWSSPSLALTRCWNSPGSGGSPHMQFSGRPRTEYKGAPASACKSLLGTHRQDGRSGGRARRLRWFLKLYDQPHSLWFAGCVADRLGHEHCCSRGRSGGLWWGRCPRARLCCHQPAQPPSLPPGRLLAGGAPALCQAEDGCAPRGPDGTAPHPAVLCFSRGSLLAQCCLSRTGRSRGLTD